MLGARCGLQNITSHSTEEKRRCRAEERGHGGRVPRAPERLGGPLRPAPLTGPSPSPVTMGLLPGSVQSLSPVLRSLPSSPSLLCPAPSAAPNPQGHHAQPPAFLPCFHLGDVPQNTQPVGGGGSLGAHGNALESLGSAGSCRAAKPAPGGGCSWDESPGSGGRARTHQGGFWVRQRRGWQLPGGRPQECVVQC